MSSTSLDDLMLAAELLHLLSAEEGSLEPDPRVREFVAPMVRALLERAEWKSLKA